MNTINLDALIQSIQYVQKNMDVHVTKLGKKSEHNDKVAYFFERNFYVRSEANPNITLNGARVNTCRIEGELKAINMALTREEDHTHGVVVIPCGVIYQTQVETQIKYDIFTQNDKLERAHVTDNYFPDTIGRSYPAGDYASVREAKHMAIIRGEEVLDAIRKLGINVITKGDA